MDRKGIIIRTFNDPHEGLFVSREIAFSPDRIFISGLNFRIVVGRQLKQVSQYRSLLGNWPINTASRPAFCRGVLSA
jgi:hypothetical protein